MSFKRVCIGLIINMIFFADLQACDVCGGAAMGNYLGIMPQFQRNIIGLRYAYRGFNTKHPPAHSGKDEGGDSKDYYQTAELVGRFFPSPKIQIYAFVPFQYYQQKELGASPRTYTGLGDISLMANYVLLNTNDSLDRLFRHFLMIGGGVKLPTGAYKSTTNNANMQMGTGSVDFTLSANYTLRYRRVGLNTEANIRLNTANKQTYKYGNKYSCSAKAFIVRKHKDWVFLPSLGLGLEIGDANQKYGYTQPYTSSQNLLASLGLDVYYQNFAFGFTVQQPTYQHISDGYTYAKTRLNLHTTFTF